MTTPDHVTVYASGSVFVDLVHLRLVPVEVFGVDHYGLSDAVSSWSDCNRAIGRIFRVDDCDPQYRRPQDVIQILVPRSELPKLTEKRWGDEFEEDEDDA